MAEALKVLQKYWNYTNFRTDQNKVIQEVLKGTDVIALLPTGGGKSICYQVPAILHEGTTIVVSPLIALMEDQVEQLRSRGISAERLHSGLTKQNISRILDNALMGEVKILYVAPERLLQDQFLGICKQLDISLVAIDEAHCISQWGHDFRPSYLQISEFISELHSPQVIAVTATATARVIQEIQEHLNIAKAAVMRSSFERSNIALSVSFVEDKIRNLQLLLQKQKGKALIYVRSRRQVQMISKILKTHGLSSTYFHAGLSYKDKKKRQDDFKNGKIQVIVATNAFGMGIDVSDISLVIHYDMPPSVEEYYQEVGRAGRNGQDSRAVLLVSNEDLNFKSLKASQDFPPFKIMKLFYHKLFVHYDIVPHEGEGMKRDLDIDALVEIDKWNYNLIRACLVRWENLGQLELLEENRQSLLVKMNMSPRDARGLEYQLGKTYNLLAHLMRSHESIFDKWVTLDLKKMSSQFKVEESYITQKLNVLKRNGAIKLFMQELGTQIRFKVNRKPAKELDAFSTQYADLQSMHQSRWQGMIDILGAEECRMKHILRYFNEEGHDDCGRCDNCTGSGDAYKREQLLEEQRRINED